LTNRKRDVTISSERGSDMFYLFGVMAIAVSGLVMRHMSKVHRERRDLLHTPRTGVTVTAIPIICGDCAGREDRPRKTFLRTDSHGGSACDTCGGTSYVLAAEMAVQRRVEAELKRREALATDPDALPPINDLTFMGIDAIVVG
jgi:hypothetical protein